MRPGTAAGAAGGSSQIALGHFGHAEVFDIPESQSAELALDIVRIEMTEPGLADFSRIGRERSDVGPTPQLAQPVKSLIPTVNIAPAVG